MSQQAMHAPPDLSEGVLDTVLHHAQGELAREVGGILAGRIYDGRAHVELAIPALRAEGHRTNVTFTHEVWDDVLASLDRDHPELRIVGWYHSHPGFGIFLSEYDEFIQNNFFAADGMVALVIDPHDGTSGWFATRRGRTIRLDGDEPIREPQDRPTRAVPSGAKSKSTTTTRGAGSLIAASALLVGLIVGWGSFQVAQPPALTAPMVELEEELETQRARSDRLESKLAVAEQALEDVRAEPPAQAAREPNSTPAIVYKVRRGDTLSSLAAAFSGKPDYLDALIEANPHVDDPNILTIGMALKIPRTQLTD